jgi:hypothetical protein
MKSHEVLRRAVGAVGAKQVAHDLGVSVSLVHKWCEEPPAETRDGSGARNPLDRIVTLVESTSDRDPIEWLCAEVGGCFVESRADANEEVSSNYLQQTHVLLSEFANLLMEVSKSIADDGRIDSGEASKIRDRLTKLQSQSEAFVRACEQGVFDNNGNTHPD